MSRGYAATGKINIKMKDTDCRDSVVWHLRKFEYRGKQNFDLQFDNRQKIYERIQKQYEIVQKRFTITEKEL